MIIGKHAPFTLTRANDDFPDPETAMQEPNGLLAIGSGLNPNQLLKAYAQGIFPWFNPGEPIYWWSPNPRAILLPKAFKVKRSLKKSLNKPYQIQFDTAFEEVIKACAAPRAKEKGTWITHEMIEAYTFLHQQGFAHSVEVWFQNQLVGGLYGISLGHAFFGESMFSIQPDTSKIALFHLCQQLVDWDFDFIDCQLPSAHLLSLGTKNISRSTYLDLLRQSLDKPTKHGYW